VNNSIARLAWRNLWRHRRRTQLLLVVVAYATIAIIFFWSFFDGFVDTVLTAQARYTAAPVLVTMKAYFGDPDPVNALPELSFINELLKFDGVAGAAPRLQFPALMRSPYHTLGVLGKGVDPTVEAQVSELPNHIVEGRMLTAPGEVVLGMDLAREIDVRLGERLVLDVQSRSGPQALGLIVVGLIGTDIVVVDENTVLVHIDDARALTGVDTATGVALDVARGQEQAVADALNEAALLPAGARAYSVEAFLSGLLAGVEAKRISMIPIIVIFAIFAAVTVLSTVVVSVLERTREFGVITSLGLDQGRLGRMVTLEATFTTALGFAIGVGLGYAMTWALSTWNVLGPFIQSFYGGILRDIALTDELYLAMSLAYLLWAAITILIAALLTALVPARRIRSLNPAEAMRAV